MIFELYKANKELAKEILRAQGKTLTDCLIEEGFSLHFKPGYFCFDKAWNGYNSLTKDLPFSLYHEDLEAFLVLAEGISVHYYGNDIIRHKRIEIVHDNYTPSECEDSDDVGEEELTACLEANRRQFTLETFGRRYTILGKPKHCINSFGTDYFKLGETLYRYRSQGYLLTKGDKTRYATVSEIPY